MRLIKWFRRPACLVGLVLLLVIVGLAVGIVVRWNAEREPDHLAQGRLALEQGDTDRAWAEFSEAVRLDPKSVTARRERARLSIRRDRWEEAVADLEVALPLAPGDSELYLLRAELYAALGRHQDRPGDLDRAIADADEALRLDPGQALAYCCRALANSAKFNDDKALADADEAVRLLPGDARVFFTRGRIRADRAEDEKAIADLSEAIRLDPNHARALALRGVSRFELHDDAAALADCNRAVELAPRDGWVYGCRARVNRQDRRCTKELADLDRAIELNPRDLSSYFQRATCHAERHDARRAFADCRAALAINPDSSLAILLRSVCHLERGRKKKALADMEKAAQLRPDSPYPHLLLAGFYCLEADKPDKALAECDLVLKRGKDHKARLVYHLRAACFLQKGDVKNAIAECNQALKVDPKSAEAYATRSVAYSKSGDTDASKADFDAALRLDREKAYQARAEISNLLKQNKEAIDDLTEVIKITPKEASPYQARAAAYLAPVLEPALMGVGTRQNTLTISLVHANLSAAEAGVQVGDNIIRVGSLKPTQFNQVVEHVANFRAGATLDLEIERNGKRMVFPLVLAARPLELRNPNPPQAEKMQAEQALSDCQQGVKLDPENPSLHRLLAEAYDLLDRHDEAIKSATEALRLDPDDPLAHLSRARSHLARKENDKAIADANEALRLEAEGGLPYMLRGVAYAEQKQEEKAKADLAEAARLEPKLAKLPEMYEQQLVQEKAAAPQPRPMPNLNFQDFKNLNLPPVIEPIRKPASEPFQGPSGFAVKIVLGIGAAVFVVALLLGYLFRGQTRPRL
jgi:tetratricopeptide (TPR) repeat protein